MRLLSWSMKGLNGGGVGGGRGVLVRLLVPPPPQQYRSAAVACTTTRTITTVDSGTNKIGKYRFDSSLSPQQQQQQRVSTVVHHHYPSSSSWRTFFAPSPQQRSRSTSQSPSRPLVRFQQLSLWSGNNRIGGSGGGGAYHHEIIPSGQQQQRRPPPPSSEPGSTTTTTSATTSRRRQMLPIYHHPHDNHDNHHHNNNNNNKGRPQLISTTTNTVGTTTTLRTTTTTPFVGFGLPHHHGHHQHHQHHQQRRWYTPLTKEEERTEQERVKQLSVFQKDQELRHYNRQLAKLELLKGINTGEIYTWSGRYKALARDYGVPLFIYYWLVWSTTALLCYGGITMFHIDTMAILQQLDSYTGYEMTSKIDPEMGKIGMAILLNELVEPFRLPVVILTVKPVIDNLFPPKY